MLDVYGPNGLLTVIPKTLTLKVFVHEGGKLPQRGKQGDAGLDCFARLATRLEVFDFEVAKIPLGFSYAFWLDGQVSHDFWLEIKNRSGVGTKSGFTTVAEVGDENYRGEIHYCVAKVTQGSYVVLNGDKIAQALIHPFVNPYKVNIVQVNSIEELGPSDRGAGAFGSSGNK